MKIKLSQIKPSPKPIRTTWDEDKIDELAQSIKEQGLIVPIKVRPTDNNHYEIVYGHRRLEALRIAGFTETDVIVEGVDNEGSLWQSIIENVCREDMTQFEEGEAYKRLKKDYGIPTIEIAKQIGKHVNWVLRSIALINDPAAETLSQHDVRDPATMAELTREPLKNDPQVRNAVIKKIAKEGLSRDQTRKVAESVAATKDPKMRERLIDAPYSPYTHDPEYAQERADRYGEHDPMARDKTPPLDEAWKLTAEVGMIVDFIKKSRQMYEEIIKMDELGKFSPEARPFLIGKLKSTVKQIQKVIDRLEE